MFIQAFPSGPFETNAYIVACPVTREAAIIDPAPGSASVLIRYINKHQLIPTKILLTHSHWDHIADVACLKKTFTIPVYVHALDKPNLESPGTDGLPCWISIEGVADAYEIKEGDEIKIGTLISKVIETPGHTPGGVCFYLPEKNTLLSGDTLFKGTIGNLSFATARPALMWDSLKKLSHLPPETRVFPGHGSSTTIQAESWLAQAEKIFGNH
jgi:glyoxylase-like metal-dependent hydrolase (beta-lactamase superfamily II)